MNIKNTLIQTSLIALFALTSNLAQAAYDVPYHQRELAHSFEHQIQVLEKIAPILSRVHDRQSADQYAGELLPLIQQYERYLLHADEAEDKLTKEEENAVLVLYSARLSPLQDDVVIMAGNLYTEKQCYESDILMQAIFPLVD